MSQLIYDQLDHSAVSTSIFCDLEMYPILPALTGGQGVRLVIIITVLQLTVIIVVGSNNITSSLKNKR